MGSSLGAISLAAREKLDNLIFVVNCKLQGLEEPVRGNGKIIQELEGIFLGGGWNVIKVVGAPIWTRFWRPTTTVSCVNGWKKSATEKTGTARLTAGPKHENISSGNTRN